MYKMFLPLLAIVGLLVPSQALADSGDDEQLLDALDRACESVVLVSVRALVPSGAPAEVREIQVTGSGFAIAPGYVVTNYHVVENAAQIDVILRSRQPGSASVVGTAPGYDLALLKVPFDERTLPPVSLGSSSDLRLGQTVLTVSNPLGLQHSVSRGVVSGLQREISGLEIGARLIQFDASINEGQSGGPLVDSRGSVVGVTTFKILGAEAIGFAIPIDLVRQTISDLERMGHPFRPEIGFSGTGVDPSLASLFELPVVWGVLVEQVEDDSVAERAGLRAGHRIVTLHDKDYVLGGDIIVAVDDAPIVGPTGLIDSFLNARPGQVLELEVVRGNKTVRIELTVPEMVH